MTYPELKIALDIEDPHTVLHRVAKERIFDSGPNYPYLYVVVCSDGDIHCFTSDGKEQDFLYAPQQCFSGDCSLEKIIIPSTVSSIEESAFELCKSLAYVSLPANLATIGRHAFCGCYSLKSLDLPSSIDRIGQSAFSCCKSLTSLDVPSKVSSIESCMFCGCTSLAHVSIPSGTIDIGSFAFSDCQSLVNLTIPKSVAEIQYEAFSNCSALQSLIFEGKTLSQVKAMTFYPWGIKDESIVKAMP